VPRFTFALSTFALASSNMCANLTMSDRRATRAKQKTPKGLEIPMPTRESVFTALRKVIKPVKKP